MRKLAIAAIVILCIAAASYAFMKNAYVLPVLMYHYVDDKSAESKLSVSPADFEAQMKFLHDHRYNVIGPNQVVEYMQKKAKVPPKTVAITFDDGTYDLYKYAYPVLKKYAFPATVFIITDKIGETGWLGWPEIYEMSNSGLVTIGSHTKSHKWLPTMGSVKLRDELVDSKRILEKWLRKKVDYLCYPIGAYNERVKRLVKEAGYRAAFATNPGRFRPGNDIYAIKRVKISRTSRNQFVFAVEISGYYTWFKGHGGGE
jgi:peptidoglycan/xylan/chitin deacetylase (PgdA/CDA1 family)